MIEPPLSPDEPLRLSALRRTNLLDTPLEERFERITRLTQRVLAVPIAALSLVDADRQWFKSAQGLTAIQTAREISFCGHTILHDEIMIVPDARVDPRFADNPLVSGFPHVIFYAGCPVRAADGSKIGTLCIIDEKPRELTIEDLQVLRDLASMTEGELSTAMARGVQEDLLAQVDSLSRRARVDSLTRLWNRDSVLEILDAELARARRESHGTAVIMADLDHFKKINDTRGHAAGDEVLRHSAKRMLGAVRDIDAVGRYGGEEFLIVVGRASSLADAVSVADRVQARIAQSPISTEFAKFSVTISQGVAFSESANGMTAETLIRAADEALYRAKRAGRNRVESTLVRPDAPNRTRAA